MWIWPLLCFLAGAAWADAPQIRSWDWQLSRIDPQTKVDLLDLEPDAVTADQIAQIKARGTYTVCYVSVGTAEDWRPDLHRFPREIIGNPFPEWPTERFLDVRRLDLLLPIMRDRFARCAALGFDAIEPDNMDAHWADTGFDLSEDDMLAYILALHQIAQELGLGLGQKNAPELTERLAGTLDFVLFEDCIALNYCSAAAPYVRRGKPALNAEYGVATADRAAACATSAEAGVLTLFKTLELTPQGEACP